jgi:hypothetical protein
VLPVSFQYSVVFGAPLARRSSHQAHTTLPPAGYREDIIDAVVVPVIAALSKGVPEIVSSPETT